MSFRNFPANEEYDEGGDGTLSVSKNFVDENDLEFTAASFFPVDVPAGAAVVIDGGDAGFIKARI